MNGRTFSQVLVCAIAAALASGCAAFTGFHSNSNASQDRGKSVAQPNDNPPAGGTYGAGNGYAPNPAANGPVTQTNGMAAANPPMPVPVPVPPPGPGQDPAAAGDPSMLPVPRQVGPGTPGAPGVPPGTQPTPGMPTDPHLRTTPTAMGSRLNLGPGDVPADRVVELSKHLETVLTQNRDLLIRIHELEALGVGREQALSEAIREVDAATAEVAKTRAAIQALQARLLLIETEDVETLKAVIAALDRLLAPRKEP